MGLVTAIPVPALTSVTSPVPEGAAHVPSPLQKVLEEADVPEFRLPTGRLPVTPLDKGKPVTLVMTPEAGVPKAGVVSVGLVKVLLVRVWVVSCPTIVVVASGKV